MLKNIIIKVKIVTASVPTKSSDKTGGMGNIALTGAKRGRDPSHLITRTEALETALLPWRNIGRSTESQRLGGGAVMKRTPLMSVRGPCWTSTFLHLEKYTFSAIVL